MSAVQQTKENPYLQKLAQSAQELKTAAEEIKEIKIFDSSGAAICAEKVYQAVQEYKEHILSCEQGVEALLKGGEIPFPFAYKLITILSSHELQFCDRLKRSLSKATSIFVQLIVFQCATQNRRLSEETLPLLFKPVDAILSTLPEEEVEMQFDLRCVRAAIQNLDYGRGRWKEVAKDNALPLLEGALVSIFSRNPAPLVSPIIDLTKRVYQELGVGSSWYQSVWPISWSQSPRSIPELRKIEDYITKQDQKSRLYIPFNRLAREILQNQQSPPDLQEYVLLKGELSVFKMADKYPGKLKKCKGGFKDTLWKSRYVSISTLGMVVHTKPPFQDAAARKIVACIIDKDCKPREKDKRVSVHLQNTLESFYAENPVAIDVEKVDQAVIESQQQLETIEEKDKEIRELEQRLNQVSQEKQELQNQLNRGFPQSSKAQKQKESLEKERDEKTKEESALKGKIENLTHESEESAPKIMELQVQQQNLQFLQRLLGSVPKGKN